MVAIAGAIAGIATAATVADNIKKMIDLVPKAPDELQQTYRWCLFVVNNQTSYPVSYTGQFFKHGRYWTAPLDILPYDSMVFSCCNKTSSILTGVEGGARFEIRIPITGGATEKIHIGIGFAVPAVGSRKASAIFRKQAEGTASDACDAVTSGSMRKLSRVLSGTNVEGGESTFNFLAVSSPGQTASVNITQQILTESLR
jgi:hypothetical protein